jgi:hypothetical protein
MCLVTDINLLNVFRTSVWTAGSFQWPRVLPAHIFGCSLCWATNHYVQQWLKSPVGLKMLRRAISDNTWLTWVWFESSSPKEGPTFVWLFMSVYNCNCTCFDHSCLTEILWEHAVVRSRTTYNKNSQVHPRTVHEGPEEEQWYSSTLSLTSVLHGIEVVNSRPRQLYPRKRDPVRTLQKAGWAPGPVWTDAENLASSGIPFPDRYARGESLYRLSHPDPHSIQ